MRMVRFQGVDAHTGALRVYPVAVDADRVCHAWEIDRVDVDGKQTPVTHLEVADSEHVPAVLGTLGETLERLAMGQK